MNMPWFRMYAEFATDPKVQMLSEADQRRYIMLLCLKCSNGDVTLHDDEIAFQLRISNDDWLQTKRTLMAKGLIDDDANPSGWDKRQYASDSSAARVAKHRARKKQACNVTCNADVTKANAVDTDTDTDTDTELNPPTPLGGDKVKFDPVAIDLPDCISRESWALFCAHRKEIGKTLRATGCKEIIGQLVAWSAQGYSPQLILKTSIANGWQGVFQPKASGKQTRSGYKTVEEQNREAAVRAKAMLFGNNVLEGECSHA